ncbi:MAG: PepSY domain-containing protein [Pseudomonadota bacterium]
MKTLVPLLALVCVTAFPLTSVAQGKWGNSLSGEELKQTREKGHVKLVDVLDSLKRSHGGRYVKSSEGVRGGRDVYIVDWLTRDGELRTFIVDAKSGKILRSN